MRKAVLLLAVLALLLTALFVAGWTWDEDGATRLACGSTIIAGCS